MFSGQTQLLQPGGGNGPAGVFLGKMPGVQPLRPGAHEKNARRLLTIVGKPTRPRSSSSNTTPSPASSSRAGQTAFDLEGVVLKLVAPAAGQASRGSFFAGQARLFGFQTLQGDVTLQDVVHDAARREAASCERS